MDERLANSLKFCQKQSESVSGYLYIIGCNDCVKIGFAGEVESRICNMQIGNPYQLRLLLKMPSLNPEVEEEMLHCEFEKYLVRGEWFLLPKEILEELLSRYEPYRIKGSKLQVAPIRAISPNKTVYKRVQAVIRNRLKNKPEFPST